MSDTMDELVIQLQLVLVLKELQKAVTTMTSGSVPTTADNTGITTALLVHAYTT
jgi:hypothetical protein